MAVIKREIDYLECTEGSSNKWYVGIDLGPAVGFGIVAYGAIDKVQSITPCSRQDVTKKLSEKRSPKKGYSDEPFAKGWFSKDVLARRIESVLEDTLRGKGLMEQGDKVSVYYRGAGVGSQGFVEMNLAKALEPGEKPSAKREEPKPIDRSVFDDW